MHQFILRMTAMAIALASTAANAEPVTLKFAFFAPETERTWVDAIKPFIDAVNSDGKGVVEIQGYANGALGRNLAQQSQLVLEGAADMAFVIPGLTPGRFPDNGAMELPGMFRDVRESTLAYTAMTAAGKLKGYEDYWVIGALGAVPSMIHTKTKLLGLADIKGKKIRATNATEAETLRALGAATVLLPTNEAAEAIARGTIDGTTMQPVPLVDFGISRVVSYHYIAGLGVSPLLVLMNKKKFDGLPVPAQDAVRRYSRAWFGERYYTYIGSESEQIMKGFAADPKRTVVEPTPAEKQTLEATYKSIIDAWAVQSPHNAELLGEIESELSKIRSGH